MNSKRLLLLLCLALALAIQDYWLYVKLPPHYLVIPLRAPLTKEPEALTLGTPAFEPRSPAPGALQGAEADIARLKARLVQLTANIGRCLTPAQLEYMVCRYPLFDRAFEYPYWDRLEQRLRRTSPHRP